MTNSVSQEKQSASKPPASRGEASDSGAEHPRSRGEERAEDENLWRREQGGIPLSYALTEDEIYQSLRYSSRFCLQNRKFRLLALLLAAAGILFLIAGFPTYRTLSLFCAFFCAAVLFLLGMLPKHLDRKRAKELSNGSKVRMTVYPDRILLDRGEKRREISLDGSARYAQTGELMLLYPPETEEREHEEGGIPLIVPLRSAGPRVLPEIQAILISGTRPRKRA